MLSSNGDASHGKPPPSNENASTYPSARVLATPPEDASFDWLHIPLEKLTAEWNVLAHTFDFPLMDRVVQKETVNQKPWREYYVNNPDLFNLVAAYYEEDLRRFGSSFSSAIITEFGEGKE